MTSSGASARPRDATFFLAPAWLRPLLILLQLLLVGLALFDGLGWGPHRALGGAIAVPILALIMLSQRIPLRHHRGKVAQLLGLYGLQVTLAAGGEAIGAGPIQALHAANAGLMLRAASNLARTASSLLSARP